MKINIKKLQEGGNTPTFSLPEINIYPFNRWGDIARSQGLETARNWRAVKEGTTSGINDFINSPQAQFVQMMLPLPQGLEQIDKGVKLISKPLNEWNKYFKINRQLIKDIDLNSGVKASNGWSKDQLPLFKENLKNEIINNANKKLMIEEGLLGENRLLHQRKNINSNSLSPIIRNIEDRSSSYKNYIKDKIWWQEQYPFYGTTSKYDVVSISKDALKSENVPGHFSDYVKVSNKIENLYNPKLNTKILKSYGYDYLIPNKNIIKINDK